MFHPAKIAVIILATFSLKSQARDDLNRLQILMNIGEQASKLLLLIESGEFEPTEDLSVVLAERFEGVLSLYQMLKSDLGGKTGKFGSKISQFEETISEKLSGLVSDERLNAIKALITAADQIEMPEIPFNSPGVYHNKNTDQIKQMI